MHPGVHVSPSLWPLFSLIVPCGMHRTNTVLLITGQQCSIWEAFASPVTEISLLLSKVTQKKSPFHHLTNIWSQADIHSQLFFGLLGFMGHLDSKANRELQRNTLQKRKLLPH